MSNVAYVSIFTWRVCVAETAFHFKRTFHEAEQTVYGDADHIMRYLRSLDWKKKYEWLIHCVAGNPSVAVVEVWSQFIYFFMFIFLKLPAVPKLSVLATVYRCLLGNRESKYLVSCVFRQPINMPKYSLSKECRQIHISVEGPFVFGLNIQPLLYMSKHQQNENLLCCVKQC